MKRTIALLVVVLACDSKTEKTETVDDMINDANVSFARKELPSIEAKLASDDPGAASSSCAVIKPDLPAIRKADAKLAATIEKRCGRDLAIRSLEVFVARAEAERAKDPTGYNSECAGLGIYLKPVTAAGAEGDPAVAKLRERHAAACPEK